MQGRVSRTLWLHITSAISPTTLDSNGHLFVRTHTDMCVYIYPNPASGVGSASKHISNNLISLHGKSTGYNIGAHTAAAKSCFLLFACN